ncbi:restriction endonuclease subunit S [Rickettsiales bacterium]|nr:restriction endonuclease subunit S [Rickettsiales bacterium]
MSKVKLKEIAKLDVGLAFRAAPKTSSNGNISVIQMKDLGDDNLVNFDNLIQINQDSPKEQYLAKKGNLIIRSRGLNNKAALINKDCVNMIVAAPLFILRITSPDILPEYLFFYLNQKSSQDYLAKCSKGSLVKMIGREDIENLPIKIPNPDQQKLIGKLANAINQEKVILDEIKQKRELYMSNILKQKLLNLN